MRAINTKDGIRIRFRKNHFYHAFFESNRSNKDTFSLARASRMPDVLSILQSPSSEFRCGWDNKTRKHSASKRVAFHPPDPFVVVVLIRRNKKTGELEGEFITCYPANPRFLRSVREEGQQATVSFLMQNMQQTRFHINKEPLGKGFREYILIVYNYSS